MLDLKQNFANFNNMTLVFPCKYNRFKILRKLIFILYLQTNNKIIVNNET
jgi:hypothetical protein